MRSGLVALLLALAAPSFVLAQESLRAFKPDEVPWVQRRRAPDVYHAALYGDPAKPGPYAYRIRAQAGHVLAPHTHPDERMITVISGTYWSGVGAHFDRDGLTAFPAGSFYVIPAGVPHFSAVLEGETVFQEAGIGPSRIDVLPSD